MARRRGLRVLVATDGSAAAAAALDTAVAFPWPAGTRASAVVARQTLRELRRSLVRAALDEGAKEAAQDARRRLARRWDEPEVVVRVEAPVRAILAEAERVQSGVLVLGWRGHGPVQRLVAGSVSRGVVRSARCSVLVVRRPARRIRTIVVGVDGSEHARRALEFVRSLPAPPGGRVVLHAAVDALRAPVRYLPRATRQALIAEIARENERRMAEAHGNLEHASSVLSESAWRVHASARHGVPLRSLMLAVRSARADLLVLGARGVTGLRRLLLGSVAEGALDRCQVPVLIIR